MGDSKLRYEAMKRNIRRILNTNAPSKPKTAGEISIAFEKVELLNTYGHNLRQTEIFYVATVDEADSSFVLFESRQVTKMIEEFIPENRNYLLDGTFDVTPVGHYQLLIIYIEFQNDVSFKKQF